MSGEGAVLKGTTLVDYKVLLLVANDLVEEDVDREAEEERMVLANKAKGAEVGARGLGRRKEADAGEALATWHFCGAGVLSRAQVAWTFASGEPALF